MYQLKGEAPRPTTSAQGNDSTQYIPFLLAFVAVPTVFGIAIACWKISACCSRKKPLIGDRKEVVEPELNIDVASAA